ncbi:hypothetical protein [Paenarthrobacter nicotinovorans]|uniref:hypothetical protein n=1 Tax=Paenarthrobacter nicotinovorans TaxID=29320 RepID=UPI0009A8A0D2|nr:hypothetical protein [Paenarthrobacter nicotinovorans]MDI2020260.1 hypothetical protein [Paenarthrobacter nicotinovorans]SKC03596.1 ppGpp synthetase catalytic domain-containing protein (RelA/SpoT-type nucleotidyltranferase) [Arthrobacter sp. 31Cvi3.1E]
MESAPWSKKQLRRLGECIRDEIDIPTALPSYDEVMLHYNDVAVDAQEQISELDWASLLGDRMFEVTSRPKTIDTLRQKLQRDHATPLSNIQDIAGVRFEAEMSLDEQDAVAAAIAGRFGHDLKYCLHDLRINPKSGYRAVHLWLRLPTRVEVQIRTHLQGTWANMYESLADVVGRDIRYGEIPADPRLRHTVTTLQHLSTEHIAKLERARNAILQIETASKTAWEVSARFPDDENLRAYATNLDANLDELRRVVQESELAVKSSLETLKASFDSIRDTRR